MYRVDRRRFLGASTAVGVTALTGCAGGFDDGQGDTETDDGTIGDNGPSTTTGPPPSQWNNTYGNDDFTTFLWGVTPTSDGGYLATGSQGSAESSQDALMLKVDGEGGEEWLETYTGPGWDWLNRPVETDNGYVGVGTKTTETHPSGEAWLLAVEEDNDVEWERTFSDKQTTWGWGIARTDDEGYLLSARTSEDMSSFRPLVVKADAEGDEEWRGTYLPDDVSRGYLDAIVGTDDGYLLTGNVFEEMNDHRRGYAIEIDAEGNELWSNRYGEGLFGPAIPVDDGYLICGQASRAEGKDGWLLAVDRDGVGRWSETYARGYGDGLADVIPAADALSTGGSYLAVGWSREDRDSDQLGWLLSIDETGTKHGEAVWDHVEASFVSAVDTANNGAYVLSGWTDEDGIQTDERRPMGRLVVTTEFDLDS